MDLCVKRKYATWYVCLLIAVVFVSASPAAAPPLSSPQVAAVMDELVATLYSGYSAEALAALDTETILEALDPIQRHTLATEYWMFDVDVPVVVSVMRHEAQETPPFWLEGQGYEKTRMTVHNELYTYEVWQKLFPAGRVGLGINGFGRHRPHYFVAVGPQDEDAAVTVTPFIPEEQVQYRVEPGASIYHDWPGLVLTEIPEALAGHILLPTIRGRAREAQIIDAFRETPHPAGDAPDMVVLTWSDEPQTTQTIQWRLAPTATEDFHVFYRQKDAADDAWQAAPSASRLLNDRNIVNDPTVRWHTATLRGLLPGTVYEYVIAEASATPEAAVAEFRTAPADNEAPVTFFWMSDTHSNTESIPLLQQAWERHPDAAFLTISGDLVGTGQERDDWDVLFANYEEFLKKRPLMPSIGNHDAIDGLGSELYRTLLHLPDNGPAHFERGQSFSLRYGNLLLISLDVTAPIAEQTDWLEATLRDSDARWKVAVFHFPPYALTQEYPDIQEEWVPVFERFDLDVALTGHVHYYMRTWPIRNGEAVECPDDGVIYLVSVASRGRVRDAEKPEYAKVFDASGMHTCQAFVVDGDTFTMYAYTETGEIFDSFTLEK